MSLGRTFPPAATPSLAASSCPHWLWTVSQGLGQSPPSGSPVAGTPTPYRDKCPRTHFWKIPSCLVGHDGPEPAPNGAVLATLCLRICKSWPVSASPHDFPTPGAPVSENVPECFPAAPDSPCGGESLFSCFLLLSVLLIFLIFCSPVLLAESSFWARPAFSRAREQGSARLTPRPDAH